MNLSLSGAKKNGPHHEARVRSSAIRRCFSKETGQHGATVSGPETKATRRRVVLVAGQDRIARLGRFGVHRRFVPIVSQPIDQQMEFAWREQIVFGVLAVFGE